MIEQVLHRKLFIKETEKNHFINYPIGKKHEFFFYLPDLRCWLHFSKLT